MTLGLTGLIAELDASNEAFDKLKEKRYREQAGRTDKKMKKVRSLLDNAI